MSEVSLSEGTDLLDEVEVGPDDVPAQEEEQAQEIKPSDANLRFETKRFVLQALFEKAASVLPIKDIQPVLKNFQVEVQGDRLRVVATDLELSVVSTTEMVMVQTNGTAVFPGKKILDIIKEAEDGEAVIDVVNGVANITIGRTTWSLKLQDGSDYPLLPDTSQVEFHTVDRVKFLGALSAVRYAAPKQSTRPSLMMIDVTNGKMTACDGVRFQQAKLGSDFPLSLQIPVGAIDDLVKLFRTTDLPEISIGVDDNYLVFRVGADVFIAQKLMAQFPNMEELLLQPALKNTDELITDRQELLDAVKRVRITADQETSAIKLELEPGKLVVASKDKNGNTCSEDLDAGWSHDARQLVVNHQFLTDMLNMADVKSCHFFLGADTKSRKSMLMLRDDESGAVGLIQQMRADWVMDVEEVSAGE